MKVASPSQEQLENLVKCYQGGKYDDAEQLASSLTQRFPKDQLAWKVLAAILAQTGRPSEALNANQVAVALDPEDSDCHNNMGLVLKALGRYSEAEESCTHAILLQPDYPEAHNNLGAILCQLDRLKEAENICRRAIALRPSYAAAHNNLGNILNKDGRIEDALGSYREAIMVNPNYTDAFFNLGNLLTKLGRLGEAEVTYTQAIALKPDFAQAHCKLGDTLQGLGRFNEAELSYAQAILYNPNFAIAYNNMGALMQLLKRYVEAEANFKQAIAITPGYASAYINLGNLCRAIGRIDEAKASYQQAIVLDPGSSDAKHLVAALSGETTETAPRSYVKKLFDDYATSFEISLVDQLGYQAPKSVAQIIRKDSKFDSLGSIVDLGCGTGLFGLEINQSCKYIEGVDISQNMLIQAAQKNIYNNLVQQDLIEYLLNTDLKFDYFVALDVFIYIGDLANLFRLIKSRNKIGGKLAFSTEDSDGDGYFLEVSGRYSHSKKYIDSLCEKFGYTVLHFERQSLRKQKNEYIMGGLYLLEF